MVVRGPEEGSSKTPLLSCSTSPHSFFVLQAGIRFRYHEIQPSFEVPQVRPTITSTISRLDGLSFDTISDSRLACDLLDVLLFPPPTDG